MPFDESKVIGFIGLGNMGYYMAINLANFLSRNKLPALRVWNRTKSKVDELIKECKDGAIVGIDNLQDMSDDCHIIMTSLANDSVVKLVYRELLESVDGKGKNIIFVEMSTVYPTLSTELEKNVSGLSGCTFITSPPFGPPPMARDASLVFCLSGQEDACDSVEPYLVPSMGRQVMKFGHEALKAITFKLIGNSIILSTIEMLSETMTLAEKTGIGADRVLEWIKIFYPAPSAIGYGTKIATDDFKATGGFTATGGKKDATHIKNLGDSVGCPMHIIERAMIHLDASIEADKTSQDKDWSSLVAGQRIDSGMIPFPKDPN